MFCLHSKSFVSLAQGNNPAHDVIDIVYGFLRSASNLPIAPAFSFSLILPKSTSPMFDRNESELVYKVSIL